MKKLSELLEKPWFAYTFALCSAVVLFMILSNIAPIAALLGKLWIIIKPLFIGFVIAYLLNPIMNMFDKITKKITKEYKYYHSISLGLTFVCVIGVIAVISILVVPSLISSVTRLIGNIPRYQKNVNWALAQIEAFAVNVDFTNITKVVDNLTETIIDFIPKNINTIVNTSISIGAFLYNVILGIIFAVYFLAGKRQLFASISQLRHATLTDDEYKRQTEFLYRCHNIIIKYIGCDLLDSLIIAILNAIAMTALHIPFVPLVSLVVGITNLAPTFGPIVGGAIGSLILILNQPRNALTFIIITVVIQTLDGYIIKPKLFGDSLGVPAVWILAAIIVGGNMFGVTGILLAIPIAAIFTFVYNEAFIPYLRKLTENRRKNKETRGKQLSL